MKRNTEVGEHLADAGEQPWLIERNQLEKRFSIGMGRQEIHLCRHREVTQFCRLTTRGRGFPAALSYRLFKTVANRVVAVS